MWTSTQNWIPGSLRIILLDLFLTVQHFRFQKNFEDKFYADQSKDWDLDYICETKIILEGERHKALASWTSALITGFLLLYYLSQQPDRVKCVLSLVRYLLYEGKTMLCFFTGHSCCSNLHYRQMGVVGIYYSINLHSRKCLIQNLTNWGGQSHLRIK